MDPPHALHNKASFLRRGSLQSDGWHFRVGHTPHLIVLWFVVRVCDSGRGSRAVYAWHAYMIAWPLPQGIRSVPRGAGDAEHER